MEKDFYKRLSPSCGVFNTGEEFYFTSDRIIQVCLYRLGIEKKNPNYDDIKSSIHLHFLEPKSISIRLENDDGETERHFLLGDTGEEIELNFYERFDPNLCSSFASWIFIGIRNYLVNYKIRKAKVDYNIKCIPLVAESEIEDHNLTKVCTEASLASDHDVDEILEMTEIFNKLKTSLEEDVIQAIADKKCGIRERNLVQFLDYILEGFSGVEIAEKFNITNGTVNSWKKNIIRIAKEKISV